MKKGSLFGYIARITGVLLIISVVVAAALAFVNSVTAPIIAQSTAEKTQKAIALVLPGGYEETLSQFPDDTGLVRCVYKGSQGYALEVTPAGFDNTITMMVGVNHEGKVLGISIISHTESAGLGAVAASDNAAGQKFRSEFVGLSGTVAVIKDGGTVDAVANATITSRAVCDGVNAALACVQALNEEVAK